MSAKPSTSSFSPLLHAPPLPPRTFPRPGASGFFPPSPPGSSSATARGCYTTSWARGPRAELSAGGFGVIVFARPWEDAPGPAEGGPAERRRGGAGSSRTRVSFSGRRRRKDSCLRQEDGGRFPLSPAGSARAGGQRRFPDSFSSVGAFPPHLSRGRGNAGRRETRQCTAREISQLPKCQLSRPPPSSCECGALFYFIFNFY